MVDGLIAWFASRTPGHWALIFVGLTALTLAAILVALRRAWIAEEYQGVRERPSGELAAWQREPTGERAKVGPSESQRLTLDPEWRERMARETETEWVPRHAWRMPDTNTGKHHHRQNGGRREVTRQLHPGYQARARSRVQWIGLPDEGQE